MIISRQRFPIVRVTTPAIILRVLADICARRQEPKKIPEFLWPKKPDHDRDHMTINQRPRWLATLANHVSPLPQVQRKNSQNEHRVNGSNQITARPCVYSDSQDCPVSA